MTTTRVTTAESATAVQAFALEGGASGSTFVGAGIAITIEGVAFHLYLATRSQLLAWTFTALNAATLIWLWRAYTARSRSVLRVTDSDVEIILGSSLRCRFPRSSIATVDPATWRSVPDVATGYVNAAKPLEPNVTIVLETVAHAKLTLGITKRVRRLDVKVADANALIADLRRVPSRP